MSAKLARLLTCRKLATFFDFPVRSLMFFFQIWKLLLPETAFAKTQ